MQELYTTYQDRLVVITWLGKSTQDEPPTDADVQDWIDTHGLTHIVVADVDWVNTKHFVEDEDRFPIPSMNLFAPGGEIVVAAGWIGENNVVDVLPSE